MNKSILLPKLALTALFKNKRAYMPYLLITAFAVFVFFIFEAISSNDIMYQLPHADYIKMFMELGQVLLAIILIPILLTTNEFLVKQRKSELGLYNVLGLDRKQIAIMMFYETSIIYVITVGGGLLVATVFAKLCYLFLLQITKLPVDIPFEATLGSYVSTLFFFLGVAGINLVNNLYQVIKAKPIDLMKASKKGEKVTRFLGVKAVAGTIILGLGYGIAMKTQVESMIVMNFFLGVMCVIVGTRMLFTAGTISILGKMKNIPSFYYKKDNFITVSGMLYRMKRNAQNLSSICIFCSMIMVTLICTLAVFNGQDEALAFKYPLDMQYSFQKTGFEKAKDFEMHLPEIAKKHDVILENRMTFYYQGLSVIQDANKFLRNTGSSYETNAYNIRVMSVEDYNQVEGMSKSLEEHEALVFSTAVDFDYETLELGGTTYKIKEELQSLKFEEKDSKNVMGQTYYVILASYEEIEAAASKMQQLTDDKQKYAIYFDVVGEQKDREAFSTAANKILNDELQVGYSNHNGIMKSKDNQVMIGGLLFLGLFFGMVFTVCMILIMYYKQVSEGFEDQKNYKLLKQVGMSDKEVGQTINKQILMVFFLPLVVAVTHTFVALQVVERLLAVLSIYNHEMIQLSSYVVIIGFTIIYIVSYHMTSKAYHKIVG